MNFRELLVSRIPKIEKLDRIEDSRGLRLGECDTEDGPQLGLRTGSGEIFAMEPYAVTGLLSQWEISKKTFDKMPRDVQAAMVHHVAHHEPKQVLIRGVQAEGMPVARAVLSDKYVPLDAEDTIDTVAPYLDDGFELRRAEIHRDDMVTVVTRREEHEVGRTVGDIVKCGLTLRTSFVGRMALTLSVSAWRLVCSNGLVLLDNNAKGIYQRHIHIDRSRLVQQLEQAVASVSLLAPQVVRQLRAAHDLVLPNLNETEGRLQKSVVSVLRDAGIWTRAFEKAATEALGREEEASVFGLIQHITHRAKELSLVERGQREAIAGRLLALTEA